MIEQSLSQSILTLTLSRANAVNSLNEVTYEGLHLALQEARDNGQVRSVVIAAAGHKAFCAGADLKEYAGLPAEEVEHKQMKFLLRCLIDLVEFPKPVVAAVHAPAVGAGMMLACACDEIVMATSAWMSLPEAQINIPAPIAAVIVGRRTGWSAMQALLQRAERFDAQRCLQNGVVDEVVEPDAVLDAAQRRLDVYNPIAPRVYAINKRWLNQNLRAQLEAASRAIHN